MKNKITMEINNETRVIDLYNFIVCNMSFWSVVELYKLLQYKMTTLEDKVYDYDICSKND